MKQWSSILRADEGQDLMEYALLVSLIAIIMIAVLTIVGVDIRDFYDDIAAALPG